MKDYLSVPNWDEMQHYKDRTPPWIKLQNELLENYEFECLPDASKAHLLCIWLLASRTNNKMNPDPRWIGRKIGANSEVDINILIKSGFLQLNQELPSVEHDASKMLQTVEQDAIPEREGEREKSRVEEDKSRGKVDKPSAIDYSILGMNDSEITEVKEIRKTNKGGKVTQRVINGLGKQFELARLAGMDNQAILTEWAMRGWKSFEFHWTDTYKKGNSRQPLRQDLSNITEEEFAPTGGRF